MERYGTAPKAQDDGATVEGDTYVASKVDAHKVLEFDLGKRGIQSRRM